MYEKFIKKSLIKGSQSVDKEAEILKIFASFNVKNESNSLKIQLLYDIIKIYKIDISIGV